MKCPKGHDIGTDWGGRKCSAITCAEAEPRFLKAVDSALAKDKDKDKDGGSTLARINKRDAPTGIDADIHGTYVDRMAAAGLKVQLRGDEAVRWGQEKLTSMLPEAVAQLQWDLRYGTPKVRSDAIQTVLRANGVAQKEAASGNAPTIVLHLGDSANAHPFLRRINKPAKQPAAEASDEED